MQSFAYKVKSELCRQPVSRQCCARAEAYGVLLFCNTFTAAEVRIITENPEFAARRLARTEIAKSQSLLVEAQAKDAGVTHYVWCTMDDEAVRDSHKKLDGQIFRFDDLSDKDGDGCPAPGQIYNCRCYARPLLPGEDS